MDIANAVRGADSVRPRPLSSTALALSPILLGVSGPALAQPSFMPAPVSQPAPAIASAIYQWKALQGPGQFSFTSLSSFMIAHPGWPGEAAMRKNAEKALRPDGENPRQVIAFFRKFPAQTPSAMLRHAEALASDGDRDAARDMARSAWVAGALSPEDESRLLTRFGSSLDASDHDARMDRLLWSRATVPATRQLLLVSSGRRPLFETRLALLTKAPDASAKLALNDMAGRGDPGFLADKVWWYRNTGNIVMSRTLLSNARALNRAPLDPAKWLEIQLDVARNAANDGQWETVWNIARQIDDTYPAGTVVRDRSFDERDDYTSIVWLGGSTSLNKRYRPLDAMRMFELYAAAARSPQTQAKGLYWAGRAAEAANQRSQAMAFYERAAQHYDQFHGQLATEKLGRTVSLPNERRTLELSASERSAFENDPLVKATVWLGQSGQRSEQTRFLRALAANVKGDSQHYLASELALRLGRPDLSVLVGRSAREDGLGDYTRTAFPTMPVPPEHQSAWTMIHAITRQESQFDREAMSPVGARGLMQLMPGTARETAPLAGVVYNLPALTQNTQDNIRLGATYFGKMMSYFGGSYVLAAAAYNAGPGNVNKWLRANGDPRLPGADVIAWIEAIPLSETRGYVQRVLENAVVYDLLNPRRNTPPRLSNYLGQRAAVYGSR